MHASFSRSGPLQPAHSGQSHHGIKPCNWATPNICSCRVGASQARSLSRASPPPKLPLPPHAVSQPRPPDDRRRFLVRCSLLRFGCLILASRTLIGRVSEAFAALQRVVGLLGSETEHFEKSYHILSSSAPLQRAHRTMIEARVAAIRESSGASRSKYLRWRRSVGPVPQLIIGKCA